MNTQCIHEKSDWANLAADTKTLPPELAVLRFHEEKTINSDEAQSSIDLRLGLVADNGCIPSAVTDMPLTICGCKQGSFHNVSSQIEHEQKSWGTLAVTLSKQDR